MKKSEKTYPRYLKMELPIGQSTFFWGARKTGKSFYLKEHFQESVYYDLLKTDLYLRLTKEPHVFREEILALDEEALTRPIIVDEVQKIPSLLDEVHWLIENTSAYFILCGSSARKLKREGVNLLGGRAWRYEFFPLVYPEVTDFDLLRALNHGLIPSHYQAQNWNKTIKAYIQDYLILEIHAEGLARNLSAFAKFLDIAAFSNGETLNFTNISRDCHVDSKTVKEYYQILSDTLLGYYLKPFSLRQKRDDIVATPKFYFFDVGIINHLTKRSIPDLKGPDAGKAFEHYILMELYAYRGLNDLDFEIAFWRTNTGLEVDFVLGDAEVAIEVKISSTIRSQDLRGLITFQQTYTPKKTLVVSHSPKKRKMVLSDKQEIEILPWKQFLKMLWNKEII